MDKLGLNLVGFVGVVEDRKDPMQLGRVRVRVIGYHTEVLCEDGNDSGAAGAGSSGAKRCLDTEQLPWSVPVQPNNSGAMNGIGISPTGLVEGTWVFGVFIDGETAQQPLVLGAIPGIPECINPGGDPDVLPDDCDKLSLQSQGFYDPRIDDELDDVPRPPKKLSVKSGCGEEGIVSDLPENNTADGANLGTFVGYKSQSHNPAQKESPDKDLAAGQGKVGVCIEETEKGENYPIEGINEYQYRTGNFLLESDTNRLARYDKDGEQEKQDKTLLKWKRENLDTGVPTASIPDRTTSVPEKCAFAAGPGSAAFRDSSSANIVRSLGATWEEPETPYDARYPYNKVMETESGHVEEWDDTPGAERYHRWHRAGTFTEIHPDGTKVEKIVGERYTIILTNDKVHIEANSDITIDKAAKIYVNRDGQIGNHFDIQVGPNSDLNINAGRSVNLHAACDINMSTDRNLTFNVGGDVIWRIGGDVDCHVAGNSDTTVGGSYDLAIVGDKTESIFGSAGFLQEIQGGGYTQKIEGASYVISKGAMTEIGLGNIYMNPLGKPSSVTYSIPSDASCSKVPTLACRSSSNTED